MRHEEAGLGTMPIDCLISRIAQRGWITERDGNHWRIRRKPGTRAITIHSDDRSDGCPEDCVHPRRLITLCEEMSREEGTDPLCVGLGIWPTMHAESRQQHNALVIAAVAIGELVAAIGSAIRANDLTPAFETGLLLARLVDGQGVSRTVCDSQIDIRELAGLTQEQADAWEAVSTIMMCRHYNDQEER